MLTVYDRVGGGDGFKRRSYLWIFTPNESNDLINYDSKWCLAHTTYGDSPIVTKEQINDFIKYGKEDIKR